MLELSLLSSYKFNVLFNSYNVYSKDRVRQGERVNKKIKHNESVVDHSVCVTDRKVTLVYQLLAVSS